jgi:outer membrane protein assembly factor BamB
MSETLESKQTVVNEKVTSRPASAGFVNLRIWPAVVFLALLWLAKAVPMLTDDFTLWMFMLIFWCPLVCALGILVWWLLASRALVRERLIGFAGLIAIGAVGILLAHESVRAFFPIIIYVLPWGITAFTGALICVYRWRSYGRVAAALLATGAAFAYWDAVRFDGLWGDFSSDMQWRFVPTAEEKYLAELANWPAASLPRVRRPAAGEAIGPVSWPGFRGPGRDATVPGLVLQTDWKTHPPKERWRRKVGPGWSSFAVAGDRLFTQEQRGDREAVVCWDADSGQERWVLEYEARFSEAVGGPGPRATPTISDGRLFALSAVGILHCLELLTGELLWKRDLRTDAEREPPMWGFSSSPLVTGGLVLVHAGGKGAKGVLAYDAKTGDLRWTAPAGDHSYSSPHLADIGGKNVVLMLTNAGISAIDAAQGKTLWEHAWPFEGYRVLQPLVVDAASLLLGTGMGSGTRRIRLAADGHALGAEELWTSRDMKPDFNDFVAHKGYLYGFDQAIFACVDLSTGQRQWKKGRYGKGQVLLLPEQDQLLVLSETGAIVLLRASPQDLEELGQHPVIEGKTWNHPVLVGNRLYARNGEQAACVELPVRNASK